PRQAPQGVDDFDVPAMRIQRTCERLEECRGCTELGRVDRRPDADVGTMLRREDLVDVELACGCAKLPQEAGLYTLALGRGEGPVVRCEPRERVVGERARCRFRQTCPPGGDSRAAATSVASRTLAHPAGQANGSTYSCGSAGRKIRSSANHRLRENGYASAGPSAAGTIEP